MVMTLTPEQQEFIQQLVDRYKFDSADAVIDEALVLLAEQRQTERMRRIVSDVDAEIAQGKVRLFTPELNDEIKANAKRILRGELPRDPDVWS